MKLRLPLLLLCLHLLTSCSGSLNKPDEQYLSPGNIIKLERSFTVPALYSHVIFQDGKIINENNLAPYRTSCILDLHDLGPTTYQAEAFTIDKVEYNEEMYSDAGAVVRYFTEFYLTSDTHKKRNILTCQILGDTMQYQSFPLTEIEQATGQYFRYFKF